MTKAVVTPGRRNGGTTVVFRLTRPATLRITVVQVYPRCERIGTFTVRGRAGVNRIRFRGRLGSRALTPGGYRLIIRARGARRDAAAVPIVVARRAVRAATVRKIRRASVCGKRFAYTAAPAVRRSDDGGSTGGVLAEIKTRLADPVGKAAGTLERTARGFADRAREAPHDSRSILLVLVGAFALASACLGSIVLVRILRLLGLSDRRA